MAIINKDKANELILKQGFSGSYQSEQVTFLLKRTHIEPTDTIEKERLIQSGEKHYSQMISLESAPTERHLQLFEQAMQQGQQRLAREVQQLAQALVAQFKEPIVLVSFVRAGVPLGVLLYHAVQDLGRDCVHYGISIIRDRGIDFAALETIIAKHGHQSIVFVDGWTGKGAIRQELQRSLGNDARFAGRPLPLVVLSDIAGCAWLAASGEDWLIPSGILGSTISGLISRSICEGETLSAEEINAENIDQWHRCIEYSHLKEFDTSQQFIQRINQIRTQLNPQPNAVWAEIQQQEQQNQSQQVVQKLAQEYDIQNINRIKPSIAEATRAILRRVPDLVLLRDADDADTRLLRYLTQVTETPVQVVGDQIAPYRAITLIQKLGKG
ncbi:MULTISPECIES: cysteine protease StiP [Acinetobacter]|uniref:cysteine protease StiP n=1 Tax=Acinetobacter TaxID=469 RepID=UPI00051AD408|nr:MULTISPECIES: cysteine protease StiP [Acinetobacter]MCH7378809.1 cysteine protease StiP family protein [Acinetobacter higginsii]MCJ0826862.1 cysteine protease StiP family protein [Acinetobacter sp. NIPH1876]